MYTDSIWRDIVHLSVHPACCAFTINMALSSELAAFAVMLMSCIEACSYSSDCLHENASDVQCCHGHCIDKHSRCYSLVAILSLAFLAVGVVIICIIGCCSCYPFCPGFRQYRRSYIIEAQPVYQQVASDPSTADKAEASSRLFYPQFVRFQPDQPIHGQLNRYPLRQLGDYWWNRATNVGQHTTPLKTGFAEWGNIVSTRKGQIIYDNLFHIELLQSRKKS